MFAGAGVKTPEMAAATLRRFRKQSSEDERPCDPMNTPAFVSSKINISVLVFWRRYPTVSVNRNLANEMIAFDGTPLNYDANDNLTSDGTNTYTWDARNHLIGISGTVAAVAQHRPLFL